MWYLEKVVFVSLVPPITLSLLCLLKSYTRCKQKLTAASFCTVSLHQQPWILVELWLSIPPDTDVFVLLVHYCSRINGHLFFDTGTGNNRRAIDMNRIANALGNEVTSALPALHVFTGCDTGSAFVGKGKVRPLKLMQGSTKHIQTFKQLGVVADTLPSDVMEGL